MELNSSEIYVNSYLLNHRTIVFLRNPQNIGGVKWLGLRLIKNLRMILEH